MSRKARHALRAVTALADRGGRTLSARLTTSPVPQKVRLYSLAWSALLIAHTSIHATPMGTVISSGCYVSHGVDETMLLHIFQMNYC